MLPAITVTSSLPLTSMSVVKSPSVTATIVPVSFWIGFVILRITATMTIPMTSSVATPTTVKIICSLMISAKIFFSRPRATRYQFVPFIF